MREALKIKLWSDPVIESFLYYYPIEDGKKRPVMLVIPGGGYGAVCEASEGGPIARRFEALGFQTFVLHYRVAPHRYPEMQQDAFRAIKLIRANADKWGAKPDQLAVAGFSAGAHLAGCCAVMHRDIEANNGDEADAMPQQANGAVLCYGVLSDQIETHQGTFQNLAGDRFEELKDQVSLELRVDKETPPVFLWHTIADQVVPYQNSLVFTEAMNKAARPVELHLFPRGPHGMQMGYSRQDIAKWPEEAKEFLRYNAHFDFPDDVFPRRRMVLTFDDAVKNHLTYVAPLLKKYGFRATFFPCRFSDEWRAKNSAYLLTGPELKELSDMGFEIGNHSFTHPDMRKLSAEECEKEIVDMEKFLDDAGVPPRVSFAYPGGPYAPNVVPLLRKYRFRAARTTEPYPWQPGCDQLRMPAKPLSNNDLLGFYNAVNACREDNVQIVVFHGIPDIVHPWCNNDPAVFEEMLQYLADSHVEVLALRDLF